ncbi:uncharacterized protein LOC142587638 [Dermacentor variabilis]|uniref:uncharacterized protein LOC142587638 n=1 Tax=Dermacentor variabilis TaxID=34621 RepID=UPI003F5B10EA
MVKVLFFVLFAAIVADIIEARPNEFPKQQLTNNEKRLQTVNGDADITYDEYSNEDDKGQKNGGPYGDDEQRRPSDAAQPKVSRTTGNKGGFDRLSLKATDN